MTTDKNNKPNEAIKEIKNTKKTLEMPQEIKRENVYI